MENGTQQLKPDAEVHVKFSGQLVEQMGDDWSPPVECRLVKQDDGTYDLQTRYAQRSE